MPLKTGGTTGDCAGLPGGPRTELAVRRLPAARLACTPRCAGKASLPEARVGRARPCAASAPQRGVASFSGESDLTWTTGRKLADWASGEPLHPK
eukprot:scaffold2357_cov399-Prasinococcus_capsulatus_cf.AAC.3